MKTSLKSCLLTLACVAGVAAQAASEHPDIIYILADDQGCGDVSDDGDIPSGNKDPFHPMRLNDTGSRRMSEFKEAIEEAAFIACEKDPKKPAHFVPVVPDEKLARAPCIPHLLPGFRQPGRTGKSTDSRRAAALRWISSGRAGRLSSPRSLPAGTAIFGLMRKGN